MKDFIKKNKVVLIICLIILIVTNTILYIGYVPSKSMEPTIPKGSWIIGLRIHDPVKAGDIIIFRSDTNHKNVVKRVIATEGEMLRTYDDAVYVNGQMLDEPYLAEETTYDSTLIKIYKDQFFVMGDNRNNSIDSRRNGTIDKQQIKAVYVRSFF